MSRWWLIIALLLSAGLNVGILATIAARQSGKPQDVRNPRMPEVANPGIPGKDPLPMLPRFADRLGLEGEERRKFLDIQWNLFQETSRLRLQLGEVHREIRREVTRDEVDRQKVDRLLLETSRIYLALERSLVNNVLATRELLDPEQERQYMALVGRLRLANPPGGMAGPGMRPGNPQRLQQAPPDERQRMMEERLEQRRQRQEILRQRFPGRRFPGRQRRLERDRNQGPPV